MLPIEVDFPDRTKNQALGIFGLVRDDHIYKGILGNTMVNFDFFKSHTLPEERKKAEAEAAIKAIDVFQPEGFVGNWQLRLPLPLH